MTTTMWWPSTANVACGEALPSQTSQACASARQFTVRCANWAATSYFEHYYNLRGERTFCVTHSRPVRTWSV